MAMRTGELMVIIRAQDYASRTLRRVGMEMSGLSRKQQMLARQADITSQMDRARARRDRALSDQKPLRIIQKRNDLYKEAARLGDQLAQSEARLRSIRSSRGNIADTTKQPFLAKRSALTFAAAEHENLQGAMDKTMHQATRLDKVINNMGGNWMRLRDSTYLFNRAQSQSMSNLSAAEAGLTKAQRAQMEYNRALAQMPIERLDRTSHIMSGMGRTMQLFGAVSTVAFGAAASKAADFNTEMSLAATQARDITAGTGQVKVRLDQMSNGFDQNGKHISGVLDLMQKYPATSQEMSAATYDIFSSMNLERKGIMDVAAGMGLLEDANKIAVASGGTMEEATQSMITVLNNFDPQLKNTTAQFDTMFDIVRFGRMRLSEFNIMMSKIAPAAKDAGNTLEDVGGAMAYLTTVMPSQRMVATGISRLLEALRHPDVVSGLHQFGVEVKNLATGRLRPLDKIITDIAEKFPELKTGAMSAADFFREVSAAGRGGKSKGVIFTQEGRRSLSFLIHGLDQYLERQRQIEQNTDEFNKSFKMQAQSLGVQWDVFMNKLRAAALQIGTDAIPAFTQIGNSLTKLMDAWNNLDPAIRKSIAQWGVFLSVGSLVAGVALTLIGAVGALSATLMRFVITSGGVVGVLGRLLVGLRRIASLAALSLLITIAMKNNTGWSDYLLSAVIGAYFGFRVAGLPGAIVGGIVVPVVIAAKGDDLDHLDKIVDDKVKSWGDKLKNVDIFGLHPTKGFGVLLHGLGRLDEKWDGVGKSAKKAAEANRSNLDPKILRDWTRGSQQADKQIKQQTDTWNKYRNAMKKYNTDLTAFQTASKQNQEDLKQWHEQLRDTTAQAGQDAVNNLRNMYKDMESVNRQAFGELFKGPWLTSESFDIAKEWGVVPGIKDMIKDLTQQNNAFAKWRSNLDKLFKRGLPPELINEIKGMGIEEGSPIMDNILKATPAQVSKLIQQFKRREGQIKSSTKMDFTDEIERFRKAGGKMGAAIIDGFENAKVGLFFDKWIKTRFPTAISAAVNEAVKRWKEGNPPPTAPTRPTRPARPTPPAGATSSNPGGVATPHGKWTPHVAPQAGDSYNFHFNIGGMDAVSATGVDAAMRQAAFVAKNAFRGAFK